MSVVSCEPLDAAASLAEAEAVHAFWFSGPVGDLFRRRWFPCDSAGAQAAADREVASRFGATLAAALAGGRDAWLSSPHTAVSLVVVLDQFSRHAYRSDACRTRQAAADARAQAAATALFGRPGWAERLSAPELVFALFPLRHSRVASQMRSALASVEERIATHAAHASLLERFRKATLRRVQEADGKAWTDGEELLAYAGSWPLDASLRARADKHPLAVATAAFLAAQPGWPFQHVVISLSGGVDSMVLALILSRLAARSRPPFAVVAAHIDYGNRPESAAEASFVEAWCAECVASRTSRMIQI